MNSYRIALILALLSVVVFAACQPTSETSTTTIEFQSTEATVLSRGVKVPVTFVHPIGDAEESYPLVVMAHGHGGTRNAAGGYSSVAEGLAAHGVASIRMDFPGCGESAEPFTQNNLSNMLSDIRASRDFAIEHPRIDKDRIGLLGFSMGGRLVLMLSEMDTSYKVIATWAPSGGNGAASLVALLGGQTAYDDMKSRAAAEGFTPFTTSWGQHQQLGLQWFTDLEKSRPLDAIRSFEGPLLVLYGDLDDVILPRIPEAVIAAASKSSEVVRHVIEGAGHGLGLFNDKPALTEEAVNTTVNFLSQRL